MFSSPFVARVEYWSVAALVVAVLLAAILRARNVNWRMHQRELAVATGTSAIFTAIVLACVPSLFWIQWDETFLLATSVGMQGYRVNGYITEALPGFDVQFQQDARSPLFPFLLSLLHDVLGVAAANAFLLNALVLFALLALVHLVAVRRLGICSALSAQLLLLSSPVLAWCARSGGYDLLSLFLLCAFVVFAKRFTERPVANRLAWLLGVGALFAYTRYESAISFALITGLAVYFAGARAPTRATLWPLAALPVLFAPMLLHFGRTGGYQGFYGFLRAFYGTEPFNASYVGPNVLSFLKNFFSLAPFAPFSGLLHLVGLFTLGWYLLRARSTATPWLAFLAAGVALPLLLLFGWVFGNAALAESLRLFLPASVVLSLLPATLAPFLPVRNGGKILLALSAVFFLARLPATITERAKFVSYPTVAVPLAERLLASLPPTKAPPLFVLDFTPVLISRGYAAVSAGFFQAHLREVQIARDHGAVGPVLLLDLFPAAAKFPSQSLLQHFDSRELAHAEDGAVRVRVLELLGPK